MEEKVFKMNTKVALFRYLAWATLGLLILSLVMFVGFEEGFSQKMILISIPVAIMFLGLILLPFLLDLKEVRITENNLIIKNLISKKEQAIPFEKLREIRFMYIEASGRQSSQGPYIYFSFKNPAQKKLFDEEMVTLNNFKNGKEFLKALATIPTTHTYDGVKVDFVDLANKWYPEK